MSNITTYIGSITTYIGSSEVGVSRVLSTIAQKRLNECKNVLMISDKRTADFSHDDLTWVNHPDLLSVLESYRIINNLALPDVVCIDGISITANELREVEHLSNLGVEFHIGQQASRRSVEETKPKLSMLPVCTVSKQMYIIEPAYDIDHTIQYALAIPTKNRPGNTDKPIVFKIGNCYDQLP